MAIFFRSGSVLKGTTGTKLEEEEIPETEREAACTYSFTSHL